LVTGGAGYIGSHIVRELADAGAPPLVVDDLSRGHRAAAGAARFVQADFADEVVLNDLLRCGDVEWIVHMAALSEVGTSMRDPAAYYSNNLGKSLALLEAARRAGVRGIVFSSSAAVYGNPERLPLAEDHPLRPTNPYGETKLAFERALAWYRRAYGLSYVSLRYFNAAGAHSSGELGEDHAGESHLVPRLLSSVITREPIPIFGTDYDTPDGTCVRDYVHVVDLARAHTLALLAMSAGRVDGEELNLGNGRGFSVQEVVNVVARVSGKRPPTVSAARRPGDPAALVASADRARRALGWVPRHSSLEEIVSSAWLWHAAHPRGYGD